MTNTEIEKKFWDELKLLASQDKVKEFYKRYAEYLEWAGIYSESRQAIYKMVKMVQLINDICNVTDIGNETAAAGCIEQDVKKYLKTFLAEELPNLLEQKIINKYGFSDYSSSDHNWDEYIRKALNEISDEL